MEDLKLVRTLLEQLEAGRKAVLCTVTDARGSVPRGPGARMAVLSDGISLGTVGGGAVELQAQQDARAMLTDGAGTGPRIYDLGAGGQTGMVCGGVVTICFTQIDAGAQADLGKWAELLESRRPGVLLLGPDGCLRVLEQDGQAASGADASIYREDIGGEGVVYLFGAGHVGRALVPVLTGLEFPVVVYDERPEAVRPEDFPTALAVVQGEFSDLSAHIHLTAADYAVVMTPGHCADLAVVRQVLAWGPSYVGCMGSRKKRAFLRTALAEAGFASEQIDAVHLPIGLEIGARTPAEIAVSVAAELIAHRAALRGGGSGPCPA